MHSFTNYFKKCNVSAPFFKPQNRRDLYIESFLCMRLFGFYLEDSKYTLTRNP